MSTPLSEFDHEFSQGLSHAPSRSSDGCFFLLLPKIGVLRETLFPEVPWDPFCPSMKTRLM